MRAPRRLSSVILCLVAAPALAGPLEDGRAKLFARDFAGAEADFTAAIETPPADDDEAAHAFRSAARIARFLDDEGTGDPGVIDSLKELFALFAFPADQRSVLDGSADPPRDAEGRLDFPPDSPRGGEVQGFIAGPLLAAIDASLADLAAVSPSYATTVTGAEVVQITGALDQQVPNVSEDLVFAAGEWKLWETALHAARAALLFSYAYDLDVDLDEVLDPDFVLAIQASVLDPDPTLLMLALDGAAILLDARDALVAAIGAYESASAAIRASDDCCFVSYADDDLDWEERLRSRLANLRTSLLTCAPFAYNSKVFGESQLQPCALLGGGPNPPISPRAVLPAIVYDGDQHPRNYVDGCDVTDPTWGGVFPIGGITPAVLADGHLRPCGDFYEDAQTLTPGETEGTLAGTSGPVSFSPVLNTSTWSDSWFRYDVPASGLLDVSICANEVPLTDFWFPWYPVANVYVGSPPAQANLVGFATLFDRSCRSFLQTESWLPLEVAAGTPLWIQVASPEPIAFRFEVPEPGSPIAGLVGIVALAALRRRTT